MTFPDPREGCVFRQLRRRLWVGLLLERLDTWHLPFPGDAAPCRSTVGGGDTPSHILLPLCTAGWVEIFRLVLQSRLLQHKLVSFPLTGSFG